MNGVSRQAMGLFFLTRCNGSTQSSLSVSCEKPGKGCVFGGENLSFLGAIAVASFLSGGVFYT